MANHLELKVRLLLCLIVILSLTAFLPVYPSQEEKSLRDETAGKISQTNLIIQSFNGTIEINTQNKTCMFNLKLTINNPTSLNISSFEYLVDGTVHSCDVKTFEGEQSLNWSTTSAGSRENLEIVFQQPLLPGNNVSISIEMLVDGYIESIQLSNGMNAQQFMMNFISMDIDSLNLVIALPITHSLTGDPPNFDIFPLPVSNYTDNSYIYYEWPELEVHPSSPSIVWIKYSIFSMIDPVTITVYNTTTVTRMDLIGTLLLSSIAAVSGAGISTIVLYYWFLNEKEKLLTSVRPVSLNIPQKKILAKIKEKGGTTSQSELLTELNFSKSKISGHLSELTESGFIKKEKIGRENRISLIRDIIDED